MTSKRRNQITGQWAARSIEMLESPAYRILGLSAHRALSRIEVELAHHGGQDNGKLPVTFDDFAEYGIRVNCISPGQIDTSRAPGAAQKPRDIPLGRKGTPFEIAGMVRTLAGPAGSYVTRAPTESRYTPLTRRAPAA